MPPKAPQYRHGGLTADVVRTYVTSNRHKAHVGRIASVRLPHRTQPRRTREFDAVLIDRMSDGTYLCVNVSGPKLMHRVRLDQITLTDRTWKESLWEPSPRKKDPPSRHTSSSS